MLKILKGSQICWQSGSPGVETRFENLMRVRMGDTRRNGVRLTGNSPGASRPTELPFFGDHGLQQCAQDPVTGSRCQVLGEGHLANLSQGLLPPTLQYYICVTGMFSKWRWNANRRRQLDCRTALNGTCLLPAVIVIVYQTICRLNYF